MKFFLGTEELQRIVDINGGPCSPLREQLCSQVPMGGTTNTNTNKKTNKNAGTCVSRTKNPHPASWQKDIGPGPQEDILVWYFGAGSCVYETNLSNKLDWMLDLFHLFALEVRVPINGQEKFRQRFFVVGQGKAKFPKDVTLFVCQLVCW